MNPILRLAAITLFSATATTVALKAQAWGGPEQGQRPPMAAPAPSPLHDLREVLPTLKLSAEQETLMQKAQGAFLQLRASQDYRLRKAGDEFRQGLAGNTPLGTLARKASQDQQEGLKQAQEAEGLWIAFLDSLDATQAGKVRKHLLERLDNMEKARARMAEGSRPDPAPCPMVGRGEPGRPQPR